MEKTENTKFYTFTQNNSGGYFLNNNDVAHYLIIEATDADEAIDKMHDITLGYSEYCECCGERWSDWLSYNDGKDSPMVYGKDIRISPDDSWFGSETIIYYYDGRKEKLWFEE